MSRERKGNKEGEMTIWTVKEWAERWKISVPLVYRLVDEEGMPCECRQPLRLTEEADEWFRKRGRKNSDEPAEG